MHTIYCVFNIKDYQLSCQRMVFNRPQFFLNEHGIKIVKVQMFHPHETILLQMVVCDKTKAS